MKLISRMSALVVSTVLAFPMVGAASVSHQLGAVGSDGAALVIEAKGDKAPWKAVYNGKLKGCVMNEFHLTSIPHVHSLTAFHRPLADGKFAFGCSNGHVFIGKNGQEAVKVTLPTNNLLWMDGYFLNLGQHNSPVFTAYSQDFNKTYDKNWLFVGQRGYLFIIDLDKNELVDVPGWHGGNYLPMGKGWRGADHSKPMTGLTIYKSSDDNFYLIGGMDRDLPKKESRYSKPIMQTLLLDNGMPVSEWVNFKDETISTESESLGVLQFAETVFLRAQDENDVDYAPQKDSSLKGDVSGHVIDQAAHTLLVRGHHHNLIGIRYPVGSVPLHYLEVWGKRVSSRGDGFEPPLLSDNFPKTYRVNSTLANTTDFRALESERDKRKYYMHHHMLSMHNNVLYSPEADREGFGRHVYLCDQKELSDEERQRHSWVIPVDCKWKKGSEAFSRPTDYFNLVYPLKGLTYYHSFITLVSGE